MKADRLETLQNIFDEWRRNTPLPTPSLTVDEGQVCGHYNSLSLSTVFQPLFSAKDMRPLAHEALLRVKDGWDQSISPPEAFSQLNGPSDVVRFDRLCRVVHVLNFMRSAGHGGDLWLNISADHLLSVNKGEHGRVFETLLQYCELAPSRIVLEILESRIENLALLQGAVDAYRERGYRVAIDDFGSRHSNFDRLWSLTPDVVKLDKTLIHQAISNPRAGKILPRLVDIIHDLGASVVCEGIETEEQLHLARASGADLVQGYFLARPAPELWTQPPAGVASGMAA